MRNSLVIVAAIVLFAAMSDFAVADTDITITGQVRARAEVSDRSFDTTHKAQQYTDLRTRVMVNAAIDDNTHAVVQFQDSRRFGDRGYSGTLDDAENVDVHQAYLNVAQLWNNGLGLKAGRFEVILGNQRVFGSVGWSNVGRSWDGIQTWLDRESVRFDAFWLKRVERNTANGNSDFDIGGAQLAVKSANLDIFGFFEHDAHLNSYFALISNHKALRRFSLGMYYHRVHRQLDFELNAVYQGGKMQVWTNPDDQPLITVSDEADIAAYMFTFETGYTFDRPCKPRVALGIDYTSGDDDPSDLDHKAYNNLYYTGHKFRGYMDYFIGSDPEGLMDLVVRFKANPTRGWTAKLDFHYFQTTADYINPIDSATTKDVGLEFDLGLTTSRVAGVKLAAGASLFLPSEAYVGMKDPDPTLWSYFQATADF